MFGAGDRLNRSTRLARPPGIPADEKLQVPPADRTASYAREIAHWLKVMQGEAQPMVKPEETLNVQRIIDAAYRSAEEGRDVFV